MSRKKFASLAFLGLLLASFVQAQSPAPQAPAKTPNLLDILVKWGQPQRPPVPPLPAPPIRNKAAAPATAEAPSAPGVTTPVVPPNTVADPMAEKWVNQLGDLDYRKRDEAVAALAKIGVGALPALQVARKHADPEIRRRAHELATGLETATLLAPRKVTLELKQKSAKEVVDALTQLTSYKIQMWGGGNEAAKFDFHWKNAPFWQVIDDLSQVAGLTIQPSYGDDTLRLQGQGRYAPYTSLDGAFRVAAAGFQHNRTVDLASLTPGRPDPRRTDAMNFTFTVHGEPRLPLLGLGEVKLNAAYDSEGNSMIPSAIIPEGVDGQMVANRVSRYYGGGKTLTIQADVALGKPSPRATSVKLLRGTIPLHVLVEQKAAVVSEKLAKGQKVKVGTTSFVIEDISESPTKQPQVKMTISEDNAPSDYTWTNSLYNRLEMFDEKGAKMMNYGSSWSHSSPNQVQITFTYGRPPVAAAPGAAAGGTPTKLVYQVWTRLQTQISFELKDLPLP